MNKTIIRKARVTDRQDMMLREVAKVQGVTVSVVMRMLINTLEQLYDKDGNLCIKE